MQHKSVPFLKSAIENASSLIQMMNSSVCFPGYCKDTAVSTYFIFLIFWRNINIFFSSCLDLKQNVAYCQCMCKEIVAIIRIFPHFSKHPATIFCVCCCQGFGHLVPSWEDPGLLGIVYDSVPFPQHNRQTGQTTRLTVLTHTHVHIQWYILL